MIIFYKKMELVIYFDLKIVFPMYYFGILLLSVCAMTAPVLHSLLTYPAQHVGVSVALQRHALEISGQGASLELEITVILLLVAGQEFQLLGQLARRKGIGIDERRVVRHVLVNGAGASIHRNGSCKQPFIHLPQY